MGRQSSCISPFLSQTDSPNHIFIPFLCSTASNSSFPILTLCWWQYFLFTGKYKHCKGTSTIPHHYLHPPDLTVSLPRYCASSPIAVAELLQVSQLFLLCTTHSSLLPIQGHCPAVLSYCIIEVFPLTGSFSHFLLDT